MIIKDLMTRNPAFCTLNTSLHDVAQLMMDNDCGCIPVVEEENSRMPIGMITDRDIVLRTVAHNKNPLNMIAGETMTEDVFFVHPDEEVHKAVELMETNHVRRLAVVDSDKNLVGMLAQADIALAAEPKETAHLVKEVSESTIALAA